MGCYNQYKARGCSYTECKSQHMLHTLALWGLVTNNREGGGYKLHKSCEVVLTWELEILAIVILGGGGRKKFPTLKVRLRWLGVVSQYPGKIYSFLFSTDILIMIINH